MTQQAGTSILYFPVPSKGQVEEDPSLTMDDADFFDHDGSLALDAYPFGIDDFEIDEVDPLVACESRSSDAIDSPDAYPPMFMVEGGAQASKAKRRLRLRDLHPMDILIVAGFLIIAAAL